MVNSHSKPMSPRRDRIRSLCKFLSRTLVVLLLCGPTTGRPAEPNKSDGACRAGVQKGTLVIVGGGNMPDLVHKRFLELAGGAKAKLVVIPTAHAKADGLEQLKAYSWWKGQPVASVVFLHTRSRDQANDPNFVKAITEATAVWLTGGDQSLLTAAYRGTAVERELHKLLERGGVIGGTSAGAAVMSSVMITGGNPHAEIGQGFGFLSGIVVDQHFQNRKRKERLLEVLEKNPDCFGLGIDEETAVIVNGRMITVLGEQKVHVCAPANKHLSANVRLLQAGDQADFQALSQSFAIMPKAP